MAIATSAPGSARNRSVMRIRRIESTQPPVAPAINPMVPPMSRPIATTTSALSQLTWMPINVRDNRSRPIPSVPSRCPGLNGGRLIAPTGWIALYGAICRANTATSVTRASNPTSAHAIGRARRAPPTDTGRSLPRGTRIAVPIPGSLRSPPQAGGPPAPVTRRLPRRSRAPRRAGCGCRAHGVRR